MLSNLPNGIFEGLISLTTLRLGGNTFAPMPLLVSLQQVSDNQFQAVISTGAPFDMVLQVSVENGSIGGIGNIAVSKGSMVSMPFLVSRTAGTTEAVTVDIKQVPSLPATHSGYTLVKPEGVPLEIFKRINIAPMFRDGLSTTLVIAENTAPGIDISTAIAATDANDDTLTYSLGGTDVSAFAIDTATGQLKTKTSLDYETKNSYSVTITVTDRILTDFINITINVTDVDENRAPMFTEGTSATRSIAENTAPGENIGKPVAATDTDDDLLTYSFGDADASSFAIDTATGQLKTKTSLDYETKTSYSVTITVYDGNSGGDSISVTINVTDVDGAAPSVQTSPEIPDNTALLSNFPNPFNPETWIPYQLAKPSDVSVTIYDIGGNVVRKLGLGHQQIGFYKSRSRAVYWNGRNNLGERVANGIYVYQLQAESVSFLRKMVILK